MQRVKEGLTVGQKSDDGSLSCMYPTPSLLPWQEANGEPFGGSDSDHIGLQDTLVRFGLFDMRGDVSMDTFH